MVVSVAHFISINNCHVSLNYEARFYVICNFITFVDSGGKKIKKDGEVGQSSKEFRDTQRV